MIYCFNCNRVTINILSAIFAILILLLFNICFKICYLSLEIIPGNSYIEKSNVQFIEENITIKNEEKKDSNVIVEWKIEIPKINLVANIVEGTTEEILNSYVGHFSETECINGNVGLAAHNRGYPVNYFARIKELEIGDEIIYKYKGEIKKYIVNEHQIIKETDWTYLENTKENRITLITCVEDLQEYRRCIQGIEKEEE